MCNKDRIYLRDAGVIRPGEEKKFFTKNEFFTRLDDAIFLSKKFSINLQLTISKNFFIKYKKLFFSYANNLKEFRSILIHLHTTYNDKFSRDVKSKNFVNLLKLFDKKLNNISGYCVHPDEVIDYYYLKKLIKKNTYMAIEITDTKSKYGNSIEDLNEILLENKFLKLVLDTSHIKSIENRSLNKKDIYEYSQYYKKCLVEIQISDNTNNYFYEINKSFKTDHSLITSKNNKIIKSLSKIKIKTLNQVIEGVVPFNKNGFNKLSKQIKILSK